MKEDTTEKLEKGLISRMSFGTLKEMLLKAKRVFTPTTKKMKDSSIIEPKSLTLWSVYPKSFQEFQIRVIRGQIKEKTVFCPNCKYEVIINTAFQECVFCDTCLGNLFEDG